jgi:beta-lactam-binding protein with PASTA domain
MGVDTAVTATFNLNPPPPAPTQCEVPKVKGLSLARAKSAITKARCKVGAIRKPKPKKGKKLGPLVVKSSSPAAGAVRAEGTKVSLTLGPKPKKR